MYKYRGTFFEIFGKIGDPRKSGKVRYELVEVLFIVISAVVCNCNNWAEVHSWATASINVKWLKKHIYLLNGIPSESRLRNIFNLIDTEQFESLFIEWIETIINLPEGDIVSVDGKTSKGSKDKKNGNKGLHIVSAICNSYGLVLGQVKTDEKSNEITAIPELLDKLYLEGCIVTIDAMGTQKKIAEKIAEKEADYVLNLKGNQESLHNDVKDYFSELEEEGVLEELTEKNGENKNENCGILINDEKYNNINSYTTIDKGHGRIEKRDYYFSLDTDWIPSKNDWVNLKGIGMVDRETILDGVVTNERCYFISSVDNVEDFAKAVRCHWGVESMHWSLDVTFRDDYNRTKKGKRAQSMTLMKRIVYNLFQLDKGEYQNLSKPCRRIKAYGDLDYRDYLLRFTK